MLVGGLGLAMIGVCGGFGDCYRGYLSEDDLCERAACFTTPG